jgi:hypothetical protein
MKVRVLFVCCATVLFSFACLFFSAAPGQAQTPPSIASAPPNLSFGVPTGTTPPTSSPETETVSVYASPSSPVTFATSGVSGANAGDFVIQGDSCSGNTFTSSTTCQVTLVFNSTQAAGILETATLTISTTNANSLPINMNGAYGAIELWSSNTVQPSVNSASFTNLYTFASANLNLSCPTTPSTPVMATLSGTPDGSGNVMVDNYITLSINGTAVSTYVGTLNNGPAGYSALYPSQVNLESPPPAAAPAGNICQGSDAYPDVSGNNTFPECFSAAYRADVTNLSGRYTDFITNANTIIPAVNGNTAGGIPALGTGGAGNDLGTNFFKPFLSESGAVQATFQAVDAGGWYETSTLFLVTNCSQTGVTPGGTVTGSPTNTNPTQTASFDSAPGQNVSITTSVAVAQQNGYQVPNVTPITTDIGIPQQLFYQLVNGTSAGPAVCFRLTAETDIYGQPMCKGFLVQCYNPSTGTTTGDNCTPNANALRDIYNAVQATSPDGPVNGFNYLYGPVGSPAADACSNVVPGGSCAQGTGPGLLLGGDNWVPCIPSPSNPSCAQPNSQTPPSPPTYSSSSCVLTGLLTGDLCPLDLLTQFFGAADPKPGGTAPVVNSIIVAVANVPLPSASASIANESNGWVSTTSPAVTFTANAGTYPATTSSSTIPPNNNFTPASTYSVTYGLSTYGSALPDTTYPVPGDSTAYNPTVANQNFVAPLCSASTTPSFTTTPLTLNTSPLTPSGNGNGIFNLHYFATDCAFTESLAFNPQGAALTNPSSNWASFNYVTFGVDTLAPTFTCPAPPAPNSYGWYTSNISLSCTATDQDYATNVSGSGFAPATSGIQGSATETVVLATNVATGTSTQTAAFSTANACDLAGNCTAVSYPGTLKIDLAGNPTITGPTIAGTAPYYVNGPAYAVNYSCLPAAGGPAILSCTSTASNINNTVAGTYTITVTAIDLAGKQATSILSYTVSVAPAADMAMLELPFVDGIPQNSTGHYYAAAIDLSTNPGNNVVITSVFTVPNGILNGSISGSWATVTCSANGCSIPSSGTSCSLTTGSGPNNTTIETLTCNVGQVQSILKLKGAVLMVNIPVLSTAPVNTKFTSVTTVSSDDDPNPKNNSIPETYDILK